MNNKESLRTYYLLKQKHVDQINSNAQNNAPAYTIIVALINQSNCKHGKKYVNISYVTNVNEIINIFVHVGPPVAGYFLID